MAGDIRTKERAAVTLTSTGASMSNGTAVSAGVLDCTSGGNAPDDLQVVFELKCQWSNITGITSSTTIASLYLVPAVDGTNYADVDTTSGASAMPPSTYVDRFPCCKAPTANTDMRFVTGIVNLHPIKYTVYPLNSSGQTIATNWTLKAISAQGQYT